jgi:hypothetical protein
VAFCIFVWGDAEHLPASCLAALSWQRWRIKDAYAIVKRLLGLVYFWRGAQRMLLKFKFGQPDYSKRF